MTTPCEDGTQGGGRILGLIWGNVYFEYLLAFWHKTNFIAAEHCLAQIWLFESLLYNILLREGKTSRGIQSSGFQPIVSIML